VLQPVLVHLLDPAAAARGRDPIVLPSKIVVCYNYYQHMQATSVHHTPALQVQLSELIRALGLLDAERTPCGQPLSPSAAHALLELNRGETLSQGDVASRLRLEKSTVSRLVSQLEARGWVTRRRSQHDGRMVLLSLTEAGQQMAERVATSRAAFFAQLYDRIPSHRRAAVLETLALLVEAVDATR
jgi:DNA-binding MarR family transcriptional regulator